MPRCLDDDQLCGWDDEQGDCPCHHDEPAPEPEPERTVETVPTGNYL